VTSGNRFCSVPFGKTLGLSLVVVLSGCASQPRPTLLGTWKSDVERTLASMRATPGIPDATRAALADDYYGHLIVEYRKKTMRAHFDDRKYDSGYQPYRVVETAPGYVVTDDWNEVVGEFQRTTTYFDAECIYGLAPEYGFREYFCPLGR
jgi:hypothetical protein